MYKVIIIDDEKAAELGAKIEFVGPNTESDIADCFEEYLKGFVFHEKYQK